MAGEWDENVRHQIAEKYVSVARKRIAENINGIRLQKNLSYRAMANVTGISESCVRDILAGDRRSVGIDQYLKVAFAFDIDLSSLMKCASLNNFLSEDPLCDDSFEKLFEEKNRTDPDDLLRLDRREETIDDSFYPARIGDHKVSSLAEFLIYLPLVDLEVLWDILQNRMGAGGPFRYEEYLLEKIDCLISKIPNSPAKRYADKYCEFIHKYMVSRNEDIKYECIDLLDKNDLMAYEDVLNGEYKITKAKRVFNAIIIQDYDQELVSGTRIREIKEKAWTEYEQMRNDKSSS